jgi:phage-related tail protein
MATQTSAPQKVIAAQQSEMEQNRKQVTQQMNQQLQVRFSLLIEISFTAIAFP